MRPRVEAEDEKDEIKAEVEREKKPDVSFSPLFTFPTMISVSLIHRIPIVYTVVTFFRFVHLMMSCARVNDIR